MTKSKDQPERVKRAVRNGCIAGDVHLTCSYPDCQCKSTPKIVMAAIEEWDREDGETPIFKSEREAYEFCRGVYNKTGGATDDLRRAYEFYLKNYDDGICGPFVGPQEASRCR